MKSASLKSAGNVVAKISALDALSILIINHVLGSRRKLLVSLNDLVYRVQKVLLRDTLSSRTDGEHTRFGADGSELCTGSVGAKSGEKLISDVSIDANNF